MKIQKYRDLTLVDLNKNQLLVISCDSSGAIGNKKNDIVKTEPEIIGYFTTQVAMMELLSFGAEVITVVNTLCVEMDNTGKGIINGIKKALKPLDLDDEVIVTGSTEENFPVSITGIGITVIGLVDKKNWEKPVTKSGMLAVVLGLPKIGDEVLEGRDEIMNISKLMELKEKNYIGEILPVGSKGILYELNEMANSNNINFILEDDINIDLKKSGGPSTCVIVSMDENRYKEFKEEFDLQVNKIAKFIKSVTADEYKNNKL